MKSKTEIFLSLEDQIKEMENTPWPKAEINKHGMGKFHKSITLYSQGWFEFGIVLAKHEGKFFSTYFHSFYQGGNGSGSFIYMKHIDDPYTKPIPHDSVIDALRGMIPNMQRDIERSEEALPGKYKDILRIAIEYLNTRDKIQTLF